ncbi:MAG: PilZ domain-containing protein [Leptospiraceae bacterium]|nr:PilZ domain-containing protein [Leptospiraceae bacterium]MDW8307411.1 PilZ domain-containing protein [Leptospiraceae bacterium]
MSEAVSVWELRRPSFRLFLLVFAATAVLFLAVRYLLPAFLHPYRWFLELQARLGFFGMYLMLLIPAVAVGILLVSKWGWYLFLIFYLQLAVYVALQIPLHTGSSLLWLILLLVAVFVVVWVLMSRTVREPFFSAEDRGWRLARRIPLKLPTTFFIEGKPFSAITRDISLTGALVETDELPAGVTLQNVEKIQFTFSGNDNVSLPCEFVRRCEGAEKILFAVKYKKTDPTAYERLRHIFRTKYHNRHLFRKPATLIWPGEKRLAKVYNISRGGCYLETDTDGLKEGDEVMVRIDLAPKMYVERGGEIVWLNPKGEFGKAKGVGIRFKDSLLMHPIFSLYYLFRIKALPIVR